MTAVPGSAPSQARRNVTDALRRGFDNAVANWMLILLRVGESVVYGVITIAAVLAVIVPMVVSAGIKGFNLRDAVATNAALQAIFRHHWMILVWSLLLLTVLLLVFGLVHSFVIAGVARVLVDGERAAGSRPGSRGAFEAFSLERWLQGGRESWWPVFWIYNGAYGLALLLACIPPLLVLAVMLLAKENPVVIVGGCLVLLLSAFIAIAVLVVAGIWCQKAIVIAASERCGGGHALNQAWADVRHDAGRHFGVALITLVIAIGGAGVMSAAGFVFGVSTAAFPYAAIVFLPVRILVSIVQSVFGNAVANWSLASFAALDASRAGA